MYFIALGISYIFFLLLTIFTIFVKPKYFLFGFLILMYIAPTAQYLVYKGIGDNFTTTTFQRVSLELINILLLVLFIIRHKIKGKIVNKDLKLFFQILLIWNLLHFVNISTSLNPTKAFIFYLMGVLGPSLFMYVLAFTPSKIISIDKLPKIIFATSVIFFSFGIFSYLYNIDKVGFFDLALQRTSGGLYLSNYSVAIMALFFPFALNQNFKIKDKITTILKSIFLFGIITMLLASVSRLGIILYPLYFLFYSIRSVKRLLVVTIILFVIFKGVNYYVDNTFGYDLIEMYSIRFSGGNTVTSYKDIKNATSDDERFRILDAIYEKLKEHPLWLINGVGIGNYIEINKLEKSSKNDYFKYSNAHNIFVNILIERGIFILFIFVVLILLLIPLYFQAKNLINPYHIDSYILKSAFHGILFCLVINYWYQDLIESSGNQTGLQAYLFFMNIGIIINLLNKYNHKKTIF